MKKINQQNNLSIFDCFYPNFKIEKPIRLIELFAGYGSQSLSLKYLGIDFEHWFVSEIDKYAIDTYNKFNITNFETCDIKNICAEDLKIIETNKYNYILTYSFPCTDLSLAGKRKGMEKGSGTRSSLLFEVERILKEIKDSNKELPQVLLMENVPQVLTSKGWDAWYFFLESLGYKNYIEILNSKDFYIPQNRERCFMVSILGNYNYNFPKQLKIKYFLKDYLEDEVDEKYYLPEKYLKRITLENKSNILFNLNYTSFNKANAVYNIEKTSPTLRACMKTDYLNTINVAIPICINSKVNGKQPSVQDRIYDADGISPAITTSFLPNILIKDKCIVVTKTTSRGGRIVI